MLVLSRKTDQVIEFPALGVSIRVVKIRQNRVQLGIEAPPQIEVMRGEKLAKAQTPTQMMECPASKTAVNQSEDGDLTCNLRRIALQISALAELANARDRRLAREVAADAIDELNRLHRHLGPAFSKRIRETHSKPAAERPGVEADTTQPACVRQSNSPYEVGSEALPVGGEALPAPLIPPQLGSSGWAVAG